MKPVSTTRRLPPLLLAGAALVLSAATASAQGTNIFANGAGTSSDVRYSSSTSPLRIADASDTTAPAGAGVISAQPRVQRGVRPFSDLALSVQVGTGGIGFNVATPLAQRMNLRGGFSTFSYNTTFVTDGLNINGALKLGNAFATVDVFPFNSSFRISPGVSFRNNNHLNASLLVPAGQSFSLGEGPEMTSDPSNPLHGTGSFVFGNNFAPRLTVGFGNMLPRKGGHFSVPVEVGFEYISQPTVNLAVSGNGCVQVAGSATPACGPVDQTYVQQEQQEIQADVNPYRFFPIASVGLSYRFGRVGRGE